MESGETQKEARAEFIGPTLHATYKASYYTMGKKISVPLPEQANCMTNLTAGKISYGYTELPFPAFYYDTIARKVAMTLGITTERYEKLKEIFGS